MTETSRAVEITLRIPGAWPHPGELLERLPAGFRLGPEALQMPDGTKVELSPLPPDEQFAGIFESSCRRPAAPNELATVRRYTVNVCLAGPGGSLESARQMMQAGAAIVRAGGAGVFIDNSALAHGGGHWLEMADDGGSDALTFAFVSLVRGQNEVWTMGMHVLGFPEIVMRRVDADADEDAIIEVIRYVASSDRPIGDGHILAGEHAPRFRVAHAASDPRHGGTPMHNPFGRWRLTSIKEIAEGN